MKALTSLVLCLFISCSALATQTDEQHIQQVIKTFDESIQNKNKEAFLALFIKKGVSWVGSFSKESMIKRTKAFNDANQNMPMSNYFTSSPEDFIDSIVNSKHVEKESFDNIKIDTDGTLASVYFDYVFYRNDKKQNWGKEAWHLINTREGWKIHSVSFSINLY